MERNVSNRNFTEIIWMWRRLQDEGHAVRKQIRWSSTYLTPKDAEIPYDIHRIRCNNLLYILWYVLSKSFVNDLFLN